MASIALDAKRTKKPQTHNNSMSRIHDYTRHDFYSYYSRLFLFLFIFLLFYGEFSFPSLLTLTKFSIPISFILRIQKQKSLVIVLLTWQLLHLSGQIFISLNTISYNNLSSNHPFHL